MQWFCSTVVSLLIFVSLNVFSLIIIIMQVAQWQWSVVMSWELLPKLCVSPHLSVLERQAATLPADGKNVNYTVDIS